MPRISAGAHEKAHSHAGYGCALSQIDIKKMRSYVLRQTAAVCAALYLLLPSKPLLSDWKRLTRNKMVGRAGFEPATNWLKANCS
ncbi:hypothetical protein, partial [Pseudomonas sp. BAV 4579]|uniref:hypothetical protein n=1 Tax=Pseudomonas sp. BAV 4579 TaxID=2654186 RepID=UPI001C49C6F9